MKLLIYGLNYAPEPVGVGKFTAEMAEWLAARGHVVEVITAAPHYPQWSFASGYTGHRYRRETRRSVEVLRCPMWLPRRMSPLRRVLAYCSFVLASVIPLLGALRRRPDVLLVIEPTAAAIPVALLCARMHRIPAWLHIQDFELGAAQGVGDLRGPAMRLASAAEAWLMRRLQRVSTLSGPMDARLERMGVDPGRRCIFPNWVDCSLIHPSSAPSVLRAELGLSDDRVVVLYSGSFGRKHGLEILVDAARLLVSAAPQVHVVLCGDGQEKPALMRQSQGLRNVSWLPLQPIERLNDLLNAADIHVLPQRASVAEAVLPSKLTGMLASGRPVVATAEAGSELARIVEAVGRVVYPGDAAALAAAIAQLAGDPAARQSLGEGARRHAEANLDRDAVLLRFEQDLRVLINAQVSQSD